MSGLTREQRLEFAALRRAADSGITQAAAAANEGAAPEAINRIMGAIRAWTPGAYERGDVRRDGDMPYWALHAHDSTPTPEQSPSATPTMWTHYHGTSPETARPFIAEGHNPYMAGHYCTEASAVYRCKQDNVIHAPSVLPGAWEAVTD